MSNAEGAKILGSAWYTVEITILGLLAPKLSISQIVNSLKGVSSRMLRKKYDLKPHNDHLWSSSYFAVSYGGAPIAKIKQYIENQNN